MILKKLVVGPFASNCYIVGDDSTKEGMIVDPGAEADGILQKVGELKLKIKTIVITHGHIDHIGMASEIKEATGAEVAIHAGDARALQGQSMSRMFGISSSPTQADRLLQGGDSIDVGELHFTVLHTPGHSPGGICLLGEGVVFCGDTLFNYSIGRTDISGGSLAQLMDSIHTKLMVLPDSTVVYSGHGPDTTIGAERRMNPFLR